MNHFLPTARRTMNGMMVVGVVFATVCWSPARAGLFDCFHHEDYKPKNVFTYPERLSLDLRRVAVLPLVAADDNSVTSAGCEALAPVLHDELIKTKRFEVVSVDPNVLRQSSGRPGWSGTETLPSDFLSSLRETYGCDAVLFCELTVFHPYPPLAVGWRLKLVDASTKQVIWAADEIFDVNDSAVSQAARHFEAKRATEPDYWAMNHSPRRFGHYTVATLLACLPNR